MTAVAIPAAPLVGASLVQRAARSFHLHLPLMIGAFAAAGALNQLNAASVTEPPEAIDQIRAMRLVEDGKWRVPSRVAEASPGVPTIGTDEISALAMLMTPPAMEVAASSQPRDIVASAAIVAEVALQSQADRLRNDPVQTARVAIDPVVQPLPPVKLTKDERAIARHIARSYRIASDSIDRFVHYAFKAAREFKLDPHLVLAVMAVESGFNPNAQSSAGAQGLMQVHTRVHTDKFEAFGGAKAAYDPLANVKVGARILSEYVKRYGDVGAGLKAYVGAALLESDGGYGSKVLSRQAEFDAVVRSAGIPATPANSASGATPAPSVQTVGKADSGTASVGL